MSAFDDIGRTIEVDELADYIVIVLRFFCYKYDPIDEPLFD